MLVVLAKSSSLVFAVTGRTDGEAEGETEPVGDTAAVGDVEEIGAVELAGALVGGVVDVGVLEQLPSNTASRITRTEQKPISKCFRANPFE